MSAGIDAAVKNNQARQARLRLLSHRLRGFDRHETTALALRRALRCGVNFIELDTRHTRDGGVFLQHCSELGGAVFPRGNLAAMSTQQALQVRYVGTPDRGLLSLQSCLDIFAGENRYDSTLCIDIKDGGCEEFYVQQIRARNLENSCVIVSWFPEILQRVHQLAPELRLCFSHISLAGRKRLFRLARFALERCRLSQLLGWIGQRSDLANLRLAGTVRSFFHGDEWEFRQPLDRTETMAINPGHFVCELLSGEMLAILQRCRGAVCLPQALTTRALVSRYRELGIGTWVFSINDEAKIKGYVARVDPELIFCDQADIIVPPHLCRAILDGAPGRFARPSYGDFARS